VTFRQLLADVRACTICAPHLPHGVRPVLQLDPASRVLVVGQAPGRKVHESGVPFADASGDRLRDWMGVSTETFYDPKQVAILPMGFCYPGTGKGGDLPPRPECAPAWRAQLLAHAHHVRLTIVIGSYAMAYHLPEARGGVTEIVAAWRDHWPDVLPLPHPSPRNNIWLRKNPWFETDVLPALRTRVVEVLG
jgi:uracil-DNA glycosylase